MATPIAHFTDPELLQLTEFLKIARISINEALQSIEREWPGSPMRHSLCAWMDQTAEFQERIQKRRRS